MPEYVCVILDPFTNLPLQGVEVEAHALSTGLIIALQKTDTKGAASFSVAESVSFHARVSNKPTIYQVVEPAGGIGSGPFTYDYLVDLNWAAIVAAGGGTEGQEFTTFHGFTFQVFSTVQGAIDAYETAAATKSMFVCPGTYTEQMLIGTNADELHIHGAGIDNVILGGSVAATHEIGQSTVYYYNLTIDRFDNTNPLFAQKAATINMSIHAFNVRFGNPMAGDHSGSEFHDCEFSEGWVAQTGDTPNAVSFFGGGSSGNFDFDTNSITMKQFRFLGFVSRGTNDKFLLYRVVNSWIQILKNSSSGVSNVSLRVTDGIAETTIIGTFKSPNTTTPAIHLTTNSGVDSSGVKIIATFANATTSTSDGRFIKQDGTGSAQGWHIDISCGKDSSNDFLEDNGGISVEMDNAVGCKFTLTPTHIAKVLVNAGSNNVVDAGDIDSSSVGTVGVLPDPVDNFKWATATELTIASGVITATQSHHTIDTEADAATDDVDTINGLVANQLYFFRPENGARTVVFKHGTGNILCIGNADLTLDDVQDFVWAFSPDGSTVYAFTVPPAAGIQLPVIGTPTYTNLEDLQTVFHSSGWISPGGVISDAGGATINVTAGDGMLRASDSPVAQLKFIEWPASNGLAITADTIRYIGVELNDPNDPQVVVRTSNNFNNNTDFILGTVVNEGGTLHIQNAPWEVGDHASAMIQRARGTQPIARDKEVGGIIFSESGTRRVVVSAGQLWRGLTSFVIGALDTDPGGAADTFDAYSSQGKENTGIAQWPNTLYDNGSGGTGSLQTIGNNKWANLWWYIELDGQLVMVYGTAQYNTQALAEAEATPSTLPDRLQVGGILAARFVFKESAGTAAEILSAFDTTFSVAGVTDHGNLAGLADIADHLWAAALAGRSGGQTLIGGTASGEDLLLQSTSDGTKGAIQFEDVNFHASIVSSDPRFTFEANSYLEFDRTGNIFGFVVGSAPLLTIGGAGVKIPAGQLDVGVTDITVGLIFAHGASSGSTDGGQLLLGLAADHDASDNFWVLEVFEDDLKIQLNNSGRGLILPNAGGVQLPTQGSGAGLFIGGDTQLYRASANVLRTPDALTIDGVLTISSNMVASGSAFPTWFDTGITGAELEDLSDGGATTLHSHAGGGSHDLLSVTHTDTLAAGVTDGSIVIGNVTPAWSELVISIPAANVRNVLGIDNGELRPSWKTALDGTDPVDIAAAASPGTSLVFSHRDHVHDLGASALAFPTWSDTGITGAELETLTDGSDADALHNHPADLTPAEHTAIGDSSPHHSKYTDADAISAVEGEATLDLLGNATIAVGKGLSTDTIAEKGSGTGVTVDGLLIKDGTAHSVIQQYDSEAKVIASGIISSPTTPFVTVDEESGAPDNLAGIDAGTVKTGDVVTIRMLDDDHAITTLHLDSGEAGVGERFFLTDLKDLVLTNNLDTVTFRYSASAFWIETERHIAATSVTAGSVELATAAETTTGTAVDRAVTPDGLNDSSPSLAGLTIRGTLDVDRQLHLMNTDQVIDTAEEAIFIHLDQTYTLEGTYNNGKTGFTVLKFDATIEFGDIGNPFGSGSLFNANATIKNPSGESHVWGPIISFVAQNIVQADGQTITLAAAQIDFFSNDTFNVINAGTLTQAVWEQYRAGGGSIGADATVTLRQGFVYYDASYTGTLTTQIGLDIRALSGAGTNIGIKNASILVEPPQSAQDISNLTTAILHAARVVEIAPQSNLGTMTVNPCLSDGEDGEIVTIYAANANSLTLPDGLGVQLDGATAFTWTNTGDNLTLRYNGTLSDWVEEYRVNL